MRLVHVSYLDGFADVERASVLLFLPHYEAEEGGLTGSVGADDAHDAVGREHEVEVVEEYLPAEGFLHAHSLDYLVAEARPVGDEDFQLLLALFLVFVEQAVVARETCLALGLARLRCHAHPFQLALQRLAALGGLLLLLCEAFRLLVEPRGVVPFPGDSFAAVEFENPAGHMVQEVAVVRHGDDGAGILLQVLFQPVYGLCVEVVGGLVEQQYVGLLQQQPAEGHAAAFAPGEG